MACLVGKSAVSPSFNNSNQLEENQSKSCDVLESLPPEGILCDDPVERKNVFKLGGLQLAKPANVLQQKKKDPHREKVFVSLPWITCAANVTWLELVYLTVNKCVNDEEKVEFSPKCSPRNWLQLYFVLLPEI